MMAPANPSQYRALLEKLAAMEHEQWMEWARTLMEKEILSHQRVQR